MMDDDEWIVGYCDAKDEDRPIINALVAALEKISNVSFPGWEAQTAVDYCRSTADAALALALGEG